MKLTLHRTSEAPEGEAALRLQAPTAVRTYLQISRILAKRGQADMTPAKVRQICGAATSKFARALMADPVIRTRLLHSPPRLSGARLARHA